MSQLNITQPTQLGIRAAYINWLENIHQSCLFTPVLQALHISPALSDQRPSLNLSKIYFSGQNHAFPGSPNSGLHRLHRCGCVFWYTWLLLAMVRSLTDFCIRFPCCSLAVCLRSRTSLQPAPECSRWWCVCGQHSLDRYFDYAW